jgi:hypothetical protein
MRLQVASDLHHELCDGYPVLMNPLKLADNVQALVLAGDIHSSYGAVDLYRDYPVPVIYVHGDREVYRPTRLKETMREIRQRSEGTALKYLEINEFDFGDVRFLGGYMWTDYSFYPLGTALSSLLRRRSRFDDALLGTDNQIAEPADVFTEQKCLLRWLASKLTESFVGHTVVVTHHIPCPRSLPDRPFEDDLFLWRKLSVGRLIRCADLWIHGQVHASSDYRFGKCRVICNPRGRPLAVSGGEGPSYENASFCQSLIVEI